MTEVQTDESRPIIFSVGVPGEQFNFEEFVSPISIDWIETDRAKQAYALMMNYRANMRELAESDFSVEQKYDMTAVAKWAFYDQFIELGIPKDLAFPFMSWAAGTVYDGVP